MVYKSGIFTEKMIVTINTRYMSTFPENLRTDDSHTTVTRTNKNVKKMYEKRAMELSRSMEMIGDELPILVNDSAHCIN